MNLRRIVILFILTFCSVLMAEQVQIGQGDLVNESLPIEPYLRYSYSQQIYRAQEIGVAGLITAVSFQYRVVSNIFLAANQELRISLGNTAQTTLSAWLENDVLELVFDGNLQSGWFSAGLPGQGWLTIPLQTGFFYDGVEHLVIAVDENSTGYANNGDDFFCHDIGMASAISFASNTINPEPPNPPATGFVLRNTRANLRLEIEALHYFPHSPQPAHQAIGIDPESVTLSWSSDASNFDLLFGTSADEIETLSSGQTALDYNFSSELSLYTSYYWQVVAWLDGVSYLGEVWQFQTSGEVLSPPQNLQGYFVQDHVQLNWDAPVSGTVVEYEIYRNSSPLTRTTETSWQDYAVLEGMNYQYYIRAINHLNQVSEPSNSILVTIPGSEPNQILFDGFEAYPAFTTGIHPWQNRDLDQSQTWSWNNINFPGEGGQMAWMVFNPSACTPPLTGFSAYSGNQALMSMSALTPPNNDWLISPRFFTGADATLTFRARSYTASYGLERLKVLVSETDTEPGSFSMINPAPYLSVPDEWTQYSYPLSQYSNRSIYLALQCISWDAFALFLDEVRISGEGGYLSGSDEVMPAPTFAIYPNPAKDEFMISLINKHQRPDGRKHTDRGVDLFDLDIYDLRGRNIISHRQINNQGNIKPDLASGIYYVRVRHGASIMTQKLCIIR